MAKKRASWCKLQYPEACTVLVGEVLWKNFPPTLKQSQVTGEKMFNKMGDKLNLVIVAVEYVQYLKKKQSGL